MFPHLASAPRCAAVGTMVMCDPQVRSRSEDFFAAIVEIVSERSDLRLEFKNAKQSLFMDDQNVPVLGCAKEAREDHL